MLSAPFFYFKTYDVLSCTIFMCVLIINCLFVLFCFSYTANECSGTHGYMAPEVLSKGTAYDSSADWFSFGCMLYKLLKGHSPFRQHKTKDKHEIDRMTLTMVSCQNVYNVPPSPSPYSLYTLCSAALYPSVYVDTAASVCSRILIQDRNRYIHTHTHRRDSREYIYG